MKPEADAIADDFTAAARRIDRAIRSLRISGRRLMTDRGCWSVRHDGRRRPMAKLLPADVDLLLSDEMIIEAEGGGYILSAAAVEEVTAAEAEAPAPRAGSWIYSTANARHTREGGSGFAGLAARAKAGEGPLSVRQAAAGLRLVADVELAGRSGALTMNWDAGPVDKQRRCGRPGGLSRAARAAERRIAAIAAALEKRIFELVWAGCVEQLHLIKLERRFHLKPRSGASALADALEKLAAVYDG